MILLGALSVDGRVALPAQRGLPVLRAFVVGSVTGGQGADRVQSRACAVVIWSAQGQTGSIPQRSLTHGLRVRPRPGHQRRTHDYVRNGVSSLFAAGVGVRAHVVAGRSPAR